MSTLSMTHESISKALCENAPLTDDQRAALLTLVMADKRGQDLWDAAARWQPIAAAPQDGRTMLLGYPNRAGKWRTVRGQWMSADYIAENWEDPDSGEPGWFETAEEAEDIPNCWPIHPTHFMPLPAAPAA